MDNERKSALHRAVMNGNTRLVKRLAARGCKLDLRDDEGARPIDIAITRGFTNVQKPLVDFW